LQSLVDVRIDQTNIVLGLQRRMLPSVNRQSEHHTENWPLPDLDEKHPSFDSPKPAMPAEFEKMQAVVRRLLHPSLVGRVLH